MNDKALDPRHPTDSRLVLVDQDSERNALVLTIASPARNSVTQLYKERVQVVARSFEDLNRKVVSKLQLHRIHEVRTTFSIQFANDRTVVVNSIDDFCSQDRKVDLLTKVVTAKWLFVFDSTGQGEDHVHSIAVRVSERPNPGLVFQHFLSGHDEDLDSLDGDIFAPISCKIDFLESRFSSELLAVITEWVTSLPKVELTFGLVHMLRRHSSRITAFVHGTFPPLVMIAALGVWMAYLPTWMTTSIKVAVAWILLSTVAFLLARYFAGGVNRQFEKHLERICTVPIFKITAGDENRMTRYLAKSHKSMYALVLGGLLYGAFKAVGLYLGGVLIARLLH